MYVVESSLHCFFVESHQSLSALYKFLDFKQVTPSNVYRRFILKCFQQLSFEGKLAHLRYLRGFVSSLSAKENGSEELEKRRMIDYLKRVEFIPAVDGSLKTASSFYDPCNELFCALLPKDSFPPENFNSEDWLSFLEKIGLIKEVSVEDFLKLLTKWPMKLKHSEQKTPPKNPQFCCNTFSLDQMGLMKVFYTLCLRFLLWLQGLLKNHYKNYAYHLE